MNFLKYLVVALLLLVLTFVVSAINIDSIPEPSPLKEHEPATLSDVSSAEPEQHTVLPDRVSLLLTESPETSIALQWRTSRNVSDSLVQVANAQGGSIDPSAATEWAAESFQLGTGAVTHKAVVDNLKPDTDYIYRVGDRKNWSEWFQFTTASETSEPFSFLFFGDVQEGARESWSRVVRGAWRNHPDSDFMLFIGDLVDDPENDDEWADFYTAMGWLSGMMPMVVTPGNHEYSGSEQSTSWNAHFRFPKNGPEGRKTLENTVYHFDYQGVRFISINTNVMRGIGLKDTLAQRSWLEDLLKDNPNQWTVVFQHAPVWSVVEKGRGSEHLQLLFAPLYEEYGVDLVLQGNDHAYGRGLSGADGDGPASPVYVISNSGTKNRAADADWALVEGDGVQLYQHLAFDGNKLSYQAITANNEIFDQFTLTKNSHTQELLTAIE